MANSMQINAFDGDGDRFFCFRSRWPNVPCFNITTLIKEDHIEKQQLSSYVNFCCWHFFLHFLNDSPVRHRVNVV